MESTKIYQVREAAKGVSDTVQRMAHACEEGYLRLTPVVNECIGVAALVVIRGDRGSGKSTLLNTLVHDIVAPHNVRGRIEVHASTTSRRATYLFVRGPDTTNTQSFDVADSEDVVARASGFRRTMASLPPGWEDANVILWYPLRPSAVSRCTVVEEHSDEYHQHDNEITLYVLNGATTVPSTLFDGYD